MRNGSESNYNLSNQKQSCLRFHQKHKEKTKNKEALTLKLNVNASATKKQK